MEALLVTLALAAFGVGVWWIVGERRKRHDDEALAEVLRRTNEQGYLETQLPKELLERAERAQRRLREAGR